MGARWRPPASRERMPVFLRGDSRHELCSTVAGAAVDRWIVARWSLNWRPMATQVGAVAGGCCIDGSTRDCRPRTRPCREAMGRTAVTACPRLRPGRGPRTSRAVLHPRRGVGDCASRIRPPWVCRRPSTLAGPQCPHDGVEAGDTRGCRCERPHGQSQCTSIGEHHSLPRRAAPANPASQSLTPSEALASEG